MYTFFFRNNQFKQNKSNKKNQNKQIEKSLKKIKLFSNKIVTEDKTLIIRFYFDTKESNNKKLYLENNSNDLYLFIQSKLEQSFVLDSDKINTYYSKEDNQIRVFVNYKDDNIKRIFINTCNNLFSNLKYFLEREEDFFKIYESFYLKKITITNEEENNILSIFENDTYFEKKITEKVEDDKEQNEINTQPLKYDYVIVGGGPGSILTAYNLAKNDKNKKILLLEANEFTIDDYKNKKYDKTNNWWQANNDNNFKNTFLDSDDKIISHGVGLGGGTLHFGLQYIDHFDLVNLNYGEWYNDFVELSDLLQPKTYNYSSNNNKILPTKAHFELLSELSSNNNFKTYNNKIYSDNLQKKNRIVLGSLLDNFKNITVKYNNKIKKVVIEKLKVKYCVNFDNEIFYGETFIIGAGAINTAAILQRSNIECGNKIYDHGAISLVYKKFSNKEKEVTTKKVDGYSDSEIEKLSLAVLSLKEIEDLNTSNKIVAIFNHTKLSEEELEKAKLGIMPSNSIKLNDNDKENVKYVYDMGNYWINGGHPGGNMQYRLGDHFNLTSTLLGRHGNSYYRLFQGRPSSKLIGVYGDKNTEKITEKEKILDLGFDNNNIIPHIQTFDNEYKWQTYYSYIPDLNDTLIVTHAQSKNIPKTGSVEIVDDSSANPIVRLNHLGNDKQKNLTINYIYDAYKKNNTSLEKLNYKYEGAKITNKYIEKALNSIYHYHGTCSIGEVVDENHKVKNTSNLYLCDLSVLSEPWPGSTSVPSCIVGMRTAKNIIEEEKNKTIFNWVNRNDNSEITIKIVEKALSKWNKIIKYDDSYKRIKFSLNIVNLGPSQSNVLGYAEIKKYYNNVTNEIKDFNSVNYYTDLQKYNLGQILPYEGQITFNENLWYEKTKTFRNDGNSHAYYIALHELGHVLGIGALWILDGAILYDEKSESFFYGGLNGNREYKNYFPSLSLSYMPIEDNGGNGTAHVHPEEGNENKVSSNDRFYNGVLHPGLDHELMTGFAEKSSLPLPLSKITIGMIEDLGYKVDYNEGDSYIINAPTTASLKSNNENNQKYTCGTGSKFKQMLFKK